MIVNDGHAELIECWSFRLADGSLYGKDKPELKWGRRAAEEFVTEYNRTVGRGAMHIVRAHVVITKP